MLLIDCFIYTLSGPDKVVHYVGVSIDPINRIKAHYNDAKRVINLTEKYTPTMKAAWIANLFLSGQELTMTIIKKCDIRQAPQLEVDYYNNFLQYTELYCPNPAKIIGGHYNQVNSIIAARQYQIDLANYMASLPEIKEGQRFFGLDKSTFVTVMFVGKNGKITVMREPVFNPNKISRLEKYKDTKQFSDHADLSNPYTTAS